MSSSTRFWFRPSWNPQWHYDVFISFSGYDWRDNLVSYLYSALSRAGVKSFVDGKFQPGRGLDPEVGRAIQRSLIALVVFSTSYAASYWCLNELEKIMDCHNDYGQVVVPIFLDVDPSDVREQAGAIGYALDTLAESRFSGSEVVVFLLRIGEILKKVARFIGWNRRDFRNDFELVEKIVNHVLEKLGNTSLSMTKLPVGQRSIVQEVVGFIKNQSKELCVVGIWGAGGLGKTTVARTIYNEIHCEFENRSFIENIKQVCEKGDGAHIHLQKQLLFDVGKSKVKIHSVAMGMSIIKKRLCGKRLLVVLDDLTEFEQLKALCGNCEWIRSGSVLMITTTDVSLLDFLKVDRVFEMKEMTKDESLQFFSWHAFRKASPREDFSELSRSIVACCGGLPLTLEVIGSYLYARTKEEWGSVLSKLERIPDDQVQGKLKISYDVLNDTEKYIFLDICCFFVGKDRDYVSEILNGCGYHSEVEITILVERSLLKVEKNGKFGMHDLLCEMGRKIIHQSSPKEPEKHSPLLAHKDVFHVWTEHMGIKAIEGLALKLERQSKVCFDTKVFEKLERLRLLKLNHVELVGDYKYLPQHLRWVNWQGFSLKHIPNNFDQRNVIAIDLKYSNINLVWKEPQLLERLKFLNLSHSSKLKHTPDFSKLPNLVKLILKHCTALTELHQSIGNLNSILVINLMGCTSLSNLPRTTYQLKSLKILILSGCSMIDKLEEDIGQMESLTTLIANDTAVKEMPRSIVRSKNIGYISLCGYEGVARDVFPSVIRSWMSPTINFHSPIHQSWSISSSLVSIDVQSNNLSNLTPMLSNSSKLRSVSVRCYSKVQLNEELRRIVDNIYDVNFTELETTSYASQVSNLSLRSLLIGMGSYHIVMDTLGKSILQDVL